MSYIILCFKIIHMVLNATNNVHAFSIIEEGQILLRCWSRTRKSWPGVQSFAGREELSAFLSQCRVLINLLPNTPETVGIINQQLLEKLPDGAYLLNLARGVHVVEDDLLAALDSGKVKGAMLDVFNREPLPPESPI